MPDLYHRQLAGCGRAIAPDVDGSEHLIVIAPSAATPAVGVGDQLERDADVAVRERRMHRTRCRRVP